MNAREAAGAWGVGRVVWRTHTAHTQTRRRTRSGCGLCEHLLVARTAWRRSLSQRCHGSGGARLGIGSSASGFITAGKLAPPKPRSSSLLAIAGVL